MTGIFMEKNHYSGQLNIPIIITDQLWEDNVKPLVSISCITYNHESYIRDAIKGFLMQKTTFPVEILVHDDASTDKTADVIRKYEIKYPNLIKPIYQIKNQYSQKNGTISKIQRDRAQGYYYAICEGDDYWTDPYKLQTQIDQMELNPECDLSFHPVIKKYADDSLPDKIMARHYGHDCIIPAKEIIMGEAPYCPTASVVIRRQSIINDAYKNANLSGSFFVKIFSSLRGGAIYIDKPMAVYRKMSVGSWSERERNIPEFFIAHHIKFIEMLRRANIATGNKFNREFDFLIQKRYDTILGSDKAPLQLRRNIYENHRNEIDFGTRLRWNALYQSKFRAKLYKLIRHIICG